MLQQGFVRFARARLSCGTGGTRNRNAFLFRNRGRGDSREHPLAGRRFPLAMVERVEVGSDKKISVIMHFSDPIADCNDLDIYCQGHPPDLRKVLAVAYLLKSYKQESII